MYNQCCMTVLHTLSNVSLYPWCRHQMKTHDDVIKWKFFPRYWPFVRGIHRSPVNSPHKGQWCGALLFSLICAWINAWANIREAGDLRRHRTLCSITVMIFRFTGSLWGEITGRRWLPLKKASGAELWRFLRFAHGKNDWIDNLNAGDLSRHRVDYDVTSGEVILSPWYKPLYSSYWVHIQNLIS